MKARVLAGLVMMAVVAALAAPAAADGVHVRLQTPASAIGPNDEFDVELYVFQADEPFNAFDAAIRFDPARFTYVPPPNSASQRGELMTGACANDFHVFSAAPDSLKISLSLLCAGISVTGPGVLYRVRFRAGATAGPATISLGPSTRFYNAGFFVDPVEKQNLELCISCPTGVEDGAGAAAFAMHAPSPNPWSGRGPASFAFDLPGPGPVSFSLHDLSGRAIVSRGPSWYGAGRHSVVLARPDVPAGIYFARLRTPHGSAARAVVVTR